MESPGSRVWRHCSGTYLCLGWIGLDNLSVPISFGGPITATDGYYFLTVNGVEVFAGLAIIPEPGTMCLLGLGLTALARRRRK